MFCCISYVGDRSGTVIKVLCYKSEGHWFDCGVIEIFLWHNLSDHTMDLGLTHPLTEVSTRRISWDKCGWCVRLTTLPPSWNLGTLTSWNPLGHSRPVMGLLYLLHQLHRVCEIYTETFSVNEIMNKWTNELLKEQVNESTCFENKIALNYAFFG